MQNYNPPELRKHKRYRVKSGIFAVLGREFSRLGQIIDISMGGLSFCYAGVKTRQIDSTEMIFLFDNGGADVNNLSYRFDTSIVSEEKIPEDKTTRGNGQKTRCALQFNDLPYHQKKWIEIFLRSHTMEEAP